MLRIAALLFLACICAPSRAQVGPPPSGGGATIANTSNVLKGDGVGNGVAATPGTDYVVPAGNVATASALAATPTPCSAGSAPTGILANGNATGCAAIGGGGITALTGDIAASGSGSVVATLPTVNSTPGTCGDATHVCVNVTNGKGLVTGQSAVAITAGTTLAGDVTGPSGSNTVVKVNSASIPAGGIASAPPVVNAAGQFIAPLQFAKMFTIGNSYLQGIGVASYQDSMAALIHRDVAAPLFAYAVTGTKMAAINIVAVNSFAPDPLLPSLVLFNGVENDSPLGTTTALQNDFTNSLSAGLALASIPYQYRFMASKATASGTWTADTAAGTPNCSVTCIYTPIGTALKSIVASSTLTYTLTTTTAQTKIGVTVINTSAQTGTFTVTIDGSLVNNPCTATTTWTSAPCNGSFASSTSSIQRAEFTVTGATSHTVLITKDATVNPVEIYSVDVQPVSGTTNMNTVMFLGANAIWTNFAMYNTLAQNVINTLHADGLPIYYVNLDSGTPGINTTTDVATAATATCTASTLVQHPNKCGHLHGAQTIENTAVANNIQFSCYNCGGNVVNQAGFDAPLRLLPYGGVPVLHAAITHDFDPLGITGYGMASFEHDAFGSELGYYAGKEGSSGLPSANSFTVGPYGTVGFACDHLWDSNAAFGISHFTVKRCTALANGSTFQLGGMSAPYIAGNSSAPTFAAGTGAGTTPTITVSRATSLSGIINVTTGTSPTASGNVVTITFNATGTQAYQAAPKCSVEPANAAALALWATTSQPAVFDANTTTALFVVTANTTALPASTALVFSYLCTQ